MDAKVKAMIKLIEEDADSFARRAEMYYKKRPELMKLVEEFYRAYRALAERYDHATGELRQAHRTMAKAFPNQVPFVLPEDSPPGSSAYGMEPQTPEMPYPMHALIDPDDFHMDALGVSASSLHSDRKNGPYSEESDSGISKRGLKHLHEMLGAGEVVPQNLKFAEGRVKKGLNNETEDREQSLHGEVLHLSSENKSLKAKVLSESERAGKAESEAENLKKVLADAQVEKEAILLQYQQCLEKLSNLEGELNRAQQDSGMFDEQARKAETEVQTLKEMHVKLAAERDAGFTTHKESLETISNLKGVVSKAQEDAKGLNERAIKAEIEAQYLKDERSRLESEKEAGLLQYRQCLEKISSLESKIAVAEEDARLLNDRADRAEAEVKNLKKALAELNEEKEAAAYQYQHCMKKISKLEGELTFAQENVNHLNSEILSGAAKLKSSEEKCFLLERSNQSLLLEADNLAKKISEKDQELAKKHEELEKLQTCVQDERLRNVQVEAMLHTLQNLHSQSQEEQRALELQLKNELQMLKDLEICKHGLEEELQQIKEENCSLNELNSSSTISMKNLQNEILSLREMKERLEEEVSLQMGKSNALQQEIFHLKEEIKGLNRSYQALLKQVESAGLQPECIGSSVKELQDENSKLRKICEEHRNEKEAFSKKLEKMEEVLQKNALLERSLSDVNGQLERLQEKVTTVQESCQFLHVDKSTLVAEKASLLSQLQIITQSMQKLLEKNTVLENSLSGANDELQGLREKSKNLEEICLLLRNERSNLLTEKGSLAVPLEKVEQRLENLEKRFTGLEEKYAGLGEEKESTISQVQQLRVSLGMKKQDLPSFTTWNETRLTGLENHIHLLQEETRWKKKDFEEEIDKAVNAQFEIFILQKFIQDMEEKNFSLLIECQKYVEASKLTEKLISELESENLEQQVEAELLLDEIEKLRLGIYKVFMALGIGADSGAEDKTENEQIFVHHILGNIEDMKCSLSKFKDDNQQLLVENSVLLTLIGQLKLEGMEIESEKNILDQELKIMTEQLFIVQYDKHELLDMNRQLRAELSEGDLWANMLKTEVDNLCVTQGDLQMAYFELDEKYTETLEENTSLLKKISDMEEEKCMVEEESDIILLETLALGNLSTIFKSLMTDKAAELQLLSQDLQNLHRGNDDLEKEAGKLRRKLEMKETENLLLNNSVERLEMDLYGVKEFNDQLKQEISSGKDLLSQRETELSEAEHKLNTTENLNSELSKTMEGLKEECEGSKLMRENLEKQIFDLSEDNNRQNKEMECLRDVNGNLLTELVMISDEIEERRNREENLSSELQEKNNDSELWEAEATGFYFNLQISSIREVLFENKVHELTGFCETLEDENASKTLEIEQMKEQISFMESELEALKAHLLAYAPVTVSLRDDVASCEHNTLSLTKPNLADHREAKLGDELLVLHVKGD
ncbi:unnamed protein product [Ilex paraguariensis]|uniref:NAB domain-containing protein n=1 Tax=Ilex paraguariensis TaxID=185542 RepID=A0ABC8STZ9_9AQUA